MQARHQPKTPPPRRRLPPGPLPQIITSNPASKNNPIKLHKRSQSQNQPSNFQSLPNLPVLLSSKLNYKKPNAGPPKKPLPQLPSVSSTPKSYLVNTLDEKNKSASPIENNVKSNNSNSNTQNSASNGANSGLNSNSAGTITNSKITLSDASKNINLKIARMKSAPSQMNYNKDKSVAKSNIKKIDINNESNNRTTTINTNTNDNDPNDNDTNTENKKFIFNADILGQETDNNHNNINNDNNSNCNDKNSESDNDNDREYDDFIEHDDVSDIIEVKYQHKKPLSPIASSMSGYGPHDDIESEINYNEFQLECHSPHSVKSENYCNYANPQHKFDYNLNNSLSQHENNPFSHQFDNHYYSIKNQNQISPKCSNNDYTKWDDSQVSKWIKNLGLKIPKSANDDENDCLNIKCYPTSSYISKNFNDFNKYAKSFKDNKVIGLHLAALTSNDLKNELGIQSLIHRKFILQSIHELKLASHPPTIPQESYVKLFSSNR